MKYFLTLLFLLLTLLPTEAAKKIEAHPINIAVSLVEKTDSAKVASTLEYYGYTFQGNEDGYIVMKHAKDNEIRFIFDEKSLYPKIIVKTHETHKSIDSRLKDLNFEKNGRKYELIRNIHSKYKTQCDIAPNNTLIIQYIDNK